MGYPKGTRRGYSIVLKIKSTIFPENDYVTNFTSRSKVVLEEFQGDVIAPQLRHVAVVVC